MITEQDFSGEIQWLLKNKNIIIIVVVLIVVVLLLNPLVMIGAGERGVVLNFGAVQDTVMGEGLHLRIPIMQKVIKMDVKIQKSQTDSSASTKDLQNTSFTIVVNHHVTPDKVNWIYQNIGILYKERIIDPSVQEVVKAVSAKYTAEELITQRERVSAEIKEYLKARLVEYQMIVDNFSIVKFSFSEQFTQAIEEKQTAEQKALKASRDLDRIKIEAKQKIEQARAEAMELRLKRSEVTPQLILLRKIEAEIKAIEKWNGILPTVTSGAVPFLNIGSTK
jgi:regulator of protease activity HflC (stomatin/prohibitin superfamily)